jgi:hypothetical protein
VDAAHEAVLSSRFSVLSCSAGAVVSFADGVAKAKEWSSQMEVVRKAGR